MIRMYRKLKPGDCPYCGKGPLAIYTTDTTKTLIDQDGNPLEESDSISKSVGYCTNCHQLVGEFKRGMFKYYPYRYPVNIGIDKTTPKENYFGKSSVDTVQVIYDA